MAKEKGDNGKVAFLESVGLTLSSAISVARYLTGEPVSALIYKIEARRGGLDMLGSADTALRYLVEPFPRLLLLSVDSHLKLVEFLENIGLPQGYMGNVFLLFPPIMFSDIKDIRTKALAFEEVGAVDRDVGKLLLKYPWILSTSIQENYEEILLFFNKEKVVLFLEDLGFDREKMGKIATRCLELYAASIDKTLKKKIEFLNVIGVSKYHHPRVINKYPEFLVSDVDRTLLPWMNYLMEIGL
ncbi:hypothetical protein Patl1_06925 [Pistacia atlantica]|uniref:Uncharacterized protein n=1 Tax=Pistacia atlantica TaxID=434234 RepID=A0ACC1AH34_9ROSI|nr:hypothetical protein Patl1_06925 [Pistacia atlantica]